MLELLVTFLSSSHIAESNNNVFVFAMQDIKLFLKGVESSAGRNHNHSTERLASGVTF